VRAANIAYIYINGLIDTSGPISGAQLLDTGPLYLVENISNSSGSFLTSLQGGVYTGSLDEVRLWNYARQSGDINSNYNKIVNPYSTGLLNYLRVITP